MEINEQNLQALTHYLTSTYSGTRQSRLNGLFFAFFLNVARKRKKKKRQKKKKKKKPNKNLFQFFIFDMYLFFFLIAEEELAKLHVQPGYSLLVLTLLQQQQHDKHLLTAAAVEFKNFVSKQWHIPPEDGGVPASDRALVKQHIVTLMLTSSHSTVQKTLSAALSIISEGDFPDSWPSLLPELIEKLRTPDYATVCGVLRTLHSITRKFRHQITPQVEQSIIYVVELFCDPLLALFAQTMAHVKSALASDHAALPELFRALVLELKLLYTLCYAELPGKLEDRFNDWFPELIWVLQCPATLASLNEHAEFEGKPGLLQQAQAQVCNIASIFVEKYEEEFAPFLSHFLPESWQLLLRVDTAPRNDRLAVSALIFLQRVATSTSHALFQGASTLTSICELVIVPNVTLTELDCELFEDNPTEYISRDIEGSDSDTRRRAACELVKALRRHYEQNVSAIFTSYIALLLERYATEGDWRAKDAAMYLVTALAVTNSTQARGASTTNPFVDVIDFYGQHVLPELQSGAAAAAAAAESDVGANIVRADALRFSSLFRQTLPVESYATLLPLFVELLRSSDNVVHSYAAACVANFLTVKDRPPAVARPTARVTPALLAPVLGGAVTNLCALLPSPTSGRRENVYVMRALLRVISSAKESILPHCGELSKALVISLAHVAANPLNATFNHYLFESLAALIRAAVVANPASSASFEGLLFPVFQQILSNDVSEFAPYVFQLLALLLEVSPNGVTAPYESLLAPMLSAVLWERAGNIPPLVRLLQAYARRGPAQLAPHIEPTLGVFQQLLSVRSTDHEAFYLLESLIEHLPPATTAPYLTTVFQLIFSRLKATKMHMNLVRQFLIFLALFIGKHDATAVALAIDSVDANMFALVLEKIWLPNVQKVSGAIERKMCVIGSVKLLTECEPLQTTYVGLWPRVLDALIALIELPEAESGGDEDDDGGDEPIATGTASFNQLANAARSDNDPFANIVGDLRLLVATRICDFGRTHPGRLMPLVAQASPEAQQMLAQYAQAAGLQLA
jgi:exportin-2 (importin alpha re-exporter)